MHLYVAGFWILLIILSAVAWLGREKTETVWSVLLQPEVGVAALLVSAAVLTVVSRPAVTTRFDALQPEMLAIDAGLFVGLAAFAVSSGRAWATTAAALQLLSATAHVARLSTPGMWRLGYQVMEEASSYPTLLLLAWGLWNRHRRMRIAGRSKNYSPDPGVMPTTLP